MKHSLTHTDRPNKLTDVGRWAVAMAVGLGVVFASMLLAMVVLVTSMLYHYHSENERIRHDCVSRGGHISEGMAGGTSFFVCIEADGTMPNVPGINHTTVIPVYR